MPADLGKARELFLHAVGKLPADQWERYVAEACGGDDELRCQAEHLLRVHREAGSFLEHPAPGLWGAPGRPSNGPAGETTADQTEARPGTTVGTYKLLEEIGEGGFGIVFMAEQQRPVRRRVALKVVKPGMDTRQVVARFEAERQALALMDHPNIARVFDGGETDSGRPYFVMELVKGIPVTDFCDQEHLTPRERLRLFTDVCRAVQHAHQKGVIHRDLKPSNVLVTLHDGTPVVKVIDFGVAKALGQRLTDKTLFTHFAQLVGTPLYMSPEQAALSGLDVDTRCDIYALGVLLYELLTGTTPFDRERLRTAGFDEMRRILREEEVPWPSTRISSLGPAARTVSAHRRSDPKRLKQLCRGELDWVVMKCLEKDRARRYETAGELARDVERYLGDEPVLACPPSAAYRFRKFARRHRAALAMATVLAAALALVAVGLAASAASVWRANRALGRALDRERGTTYFQRVALAARELAGLHAARAEELLDQCPADQRGWEWHLLKRRLHEEPLVLTGHPVSVGSVAFRPDGRVLASADGEVRLWDPTTGRHLGTLAASTSPGEWTVRMVFRQDGRRLAAANWDGTVIVWDLDAGRKRVSEGHAGRVNAVALNPDGRHLASAGTDGTVLVWDLEDQTRSVFARTGVEISDVVYSPDGGRLAWAGGDHAVHVVDARTKEPIYTREDPRLSPRRLLFSPDGRTLAVGGDRTVRLWEAATGREVRELRGHTESVQALAFSPDGRRLASGGDNTVRLWDPVSGQEAVTLDEHAGPIYGLAFSPDGNRLASAGGHGTDNTVRIWNATPTEEQNTEPVRTDAGHTRDASCLAFGGEGRLLASCSYDGTVRVCGVSTDGVTLALRGDLVPDLNGLAFSPDGTRIAAVGDNRIIDAWDVRTGREVWGGARKTGRANLTGVAFSPDGRHLAVADFTGVFLLEAATGRELPPLEVNVGALCVAYRPDGRRVAAACLDKAVRVWSTDDDRTVQVLRGHEASVWSVAFRSDGRYLASAGEDGLVIVWDATDVGGIREAWRVRAHHDVVNSVAFSPDGRHLASASRDGTVKVWDAGTGEGRRLIRARQREVYAVAYHPEGKLLSCWP
jgi:WD40 repeat protein/serine/threonine protein kinase